MSQIGILSSSRRAHAWPTLLGVATLALLLCSHAARAGQTRQAVKARHGEIVLLRTVPTRPATRQEPPGMALMVDPRPNAALQSMLGTSTELNDAQIAALSAEPVQAVTHRLGHAMTQMLSAAPGAAAQGNARINASAGIAPMGGVGQTTRALGNTVQQAMHSIPVPSSPH